MTAKYRYRYQGHTTHGARTRFDRVLKKLGQVSYIRGYRYRGKYGLDERVLVRGVNGTARFSGLLWGYGGEGPRGTHELLLKLGMTPEEADKVAFRSHRYDTVGEDWRVDFLPFYNRR